MRLFICLSSFPPSVGGVEASVSDAGLDSLFDVGVLFALTDRLPLGFLVDIDVSLYRIKEDMNTLEVYHVLWLLG